MIHLPSVRHFPMLDDLRKQYDQSVDLEQAVKLVVRPLLPGLYGLYDLYGWHDLHDLYFVQLKPKSK